MSPLDRREAVLRELNLYPLWQRRGGPARVETALEEVHSASPEPSVNHSGQSPGALKAGGLAAIGSVTGEKHAADAPVGVTDRSREQRIGELDWPQLDAMVRDCSACGLRAGCTQTVFGTGDERAEWLFIGDQPGADEEKLGEPFVGQAGKLLDNMLMSINLRRGQRVYIANIIKCRPPDDRAPETDEIATCLPYLKRQIELLRPKLIVALGKTASTALLGRDAPLGSLRGKVHDFKLPATEFSGAQEQESSQPSSLPHQPTSSHRVGTIPLVVTYHPAYLLRSPPEKAKAWHDLCLAAENMQKL